MDIPSYSVRPGQVVMLKPGSAVTPLASAATDLTSVVSGWLEADFESLTGKVLREPAREEIPAPVEEQLVVEFYARR